MRGALAILSEPRRPRPELVDLAGNPRATPACKNRRLSTCPASDVFLVFPLGARADVVVAELVCRCSRTSRRRDTLWVQGQPGGADDARALWHRISWLYGTHQARNSVDSLGSHFGRTVRTPVCQSNWRCVVRDGRSSIRLEASHLAHDWRGLGEFLERGPACNTTSVFIPHTASVTSKVVDHAGVAQMLCLRHERAANFGDRSTFWQ